MSITLEELRPQNQHLKTVGLNDSVPKVIGLLHQYDLDQIPVVHDDGITSLDQVVTFDSILQAICSMGTGIGVLCVRDVAKKARTYRNDADLLTVLDDVQRESFALIVNESNHLVGIVTTSDIAVFFREYAQDLMLIEGIESRIKEAILALYGEDDNGLEAAIAKVTDRYSQIRKQVPTAIRGFCEKSGLDFPRTGNEDAIAEAITRLKLPKPGKEFEKLSFDEFSQVLLAHDTAPSIAQSIELSDLRKLLNKVRDGRNKLAHFRGDLTAEERRSIQFASDWLERNLPALDSSFEGTTATTTTPAPGHENEEPPVGSYAPLVSHLKQQGNEIKSLTLTFSEIETILAKPLPESARVYRIWWANDPSTPQSASWLIEGWRTKSLSMTERRITFVRTNDREDAYIRFFARVRKSLMERTEFPLYETSPQGQNWLILASYGRDLVRIHAVFTRRQQLGVELYFSGTDQQQNEDRFDRIEQEKATIETRIGEALCWEKLEGKTACRIACYTDGNILTDADSEDLIAWVRDKAADFHAVFGPRLVD